MSLFIEYIHPLTEWLRANPHWALFLTFLISMTESIAVIGTIIPGSVTMTAIGILAGSGVMPVDQTLIAATLGAMVGDNVSYAIGYIYRDRIKEVWPFSRYPTWIDYGNEFFRRHGGKSVFIGRFVGPIRSLIPVIAGIMHMKQWRFFIANFLSAIGWSIGHVMPGVLIGAASHGLSPEAATKLFLLVLLALVCIWLISLIIKWSVIKLHFFFRRHLHEFWLLFRGHPFLLKMFKALTPIEEDNHYPTVALLFLCVLSIISIFLLTLLTIQAEWVQAMNTPIFWLMESFRTSALDYFFIACTQLTSLFTLCIFISICSIVLCYKRNFKTLLFLLSVVFSCTLLSMVLSLLVQAPRPPGLLIPMQGFAFPNIYLAIATAVYSSVVFYVNNKYSTLTHTLRSFVLIILSLSGLGSLYLADYWLTDILASYFLGISICLVHWIIYRSTHYTVIKKHLSLTMIIIIFSIILVGATIATMVNYKKLFHNHTPIHKQYILKHEQWWEQKTPLLPVYKYNRFGKIIGLYNFQYSGDIDFLQSNLEEFGWVAFTDSFFQDLLKRITNQDNAVDLPLLSQLYQNKKPELVMTYHHGNDPFEFVLRIWESNYHIENEDSAIWIGSIEAMSHKKTKHEDILVAQAQLNPLTYLLPALPLFTIRRIEIPSLMLKQTKYPIMPYILLIKQSEDLDQSSTSP